MPVALFAHAGSFSWDEALLVMLPLLAIAGLLWRANRRASRLHADDRPADMIDEHVDRPSEQ